MAAEYLIEVSVCPRLNIGGRRETQHKKRSFRISDEAPDFNYNLREPASIPWMFVVEQSEIRGDRTRISEGQCARERTPGKA